MKIEKLVKKLIQMARKPFGLSYKNLTVKTSYNKISFYATVLKYRRESETEELVKEVSINDLCSLDSGLFQFVCKNNLSKISYDDYHKVLRGSSPDIMLMLSSIQEDKVNFLLDNINLPND